MRSIAARLALSCLVLFGCLPDRVVDAPTQMLVAVESTNASLKDRFTHIRASIYRREGDTWAPGSTKLFPRSVISWPIDLPVTPGAKDDRAKQFEVIVEALQDDEVMAQTRAVTRFLPGQRLLLRLWLESCPGSAGPFCDDLECHGPECEVCKAGRCTKVDETNPSELPPQSTDGRPTSFDDVALDGGSPPGAGRDAETRDASRDARARDASTDEGDSSVPAPDGSMDPDPASDAGPMEVTCTEEGALRCSMAGTALRQECKGGQWMVAAPCESGKVCNGSSMPAGGCRELDAVCAGNAGKAVCDGAVMRTCDAQGTVTKSEMCASVNHCQRGVTSGQCAKCLSGQHECAGMELRVCNDEGTGFVEKTQCPSAALCNATAGKCGTGCTAGSKICVGDALQRCKADLTGFELEMGCPAGLCDQAGQQCDMCSPQTKSCVGNSVRTCNAQGQGSTTQACAAPKGVCTGAGVCVECTATSGCPASSNPCFTSSCDVASGTCKSTVNLRARCASGVCDSSGACVGCIDSSDCRTAGASQCSGGRCVECTANSHCNEANHEICQDRRCIVGPYCGDGIVNPGESCDPKAPGWNTFTCNERCSVRKIYNACDSDDQCDPGVTCGLSYCWYRCSTASDCPAPPAGSGLTPICWSGQACMLTGCRTNADCPPGVLCAAAADGTRLCSGCSDSNPCPAGQTCRFTYDSAGQPRTSGLCR